MPQESASAASHGRKHGRKPIKLEQVKEAMRRDLQSSRQTVDSLRSMLEKNLAERYGVSRDTARKARDAVLPEFVEESNHDK
jgi:DNA-binding GntR family transcriptional regulator